MSPVYTKEGRGEVEVFARRQKDFSHAPHAEKTKRKRVDLRICDSYNPTSLLRFCSLESFYFFPISNQIKEIKERKA